MVNSWVVGPCMSKTLGSPSSGVTGLCSVRVLLRWFTFKLLLVHLYGRLIARLSADTPHASFIVAFNNNKKQAKVDGSIIAQSIMRVNEL